MTARLLTNKKKKAKKKKRKKKNEGEEEEEEEKQKKIKEREGEREKFFESNAFVTCGMAKCYCSKRELIKANRTCSESLTVILTKYKSDSLL